MDAEVTDTGPTYFYVRDKGKAAAHHWDYITDRSDHALCGHAYEDPSTLGEVARPKQVCRACQDRLPEYLAVWWQKKAHALIGERRSVESELQVALANLEAVKSELDALQKHSDNQRRTLAALQNKMREIKATGGQRTSKPDSTAEGTDVAGVENSEEAAIAAGIAIRRATDALRKLCRERPGAISHHEVLKAMNRSISSLDATQRQMLRVEMNRFGSPLGWARSELRAMGRRVT